MSTTNNGGPAFPIPGLQCDSDFNGMTLRDYFAGQAMIGRLDNNESTFEKDAQWAYKLADAMLTERAK